MDMKSEVIEVNNCRVCDSNELIPVLSLGDQYPNDFVTDETIVDKKSRVPLDLVICGQTDCGLLQLKHTYSRVALYDNYWFRSSINETMIKALEDITENIELDPKKLVTCLICGNSASSNPCSVCTVSYTHLTLPTSDLV